MRLETSELATTDQRVLSVRVAVLLGVPDNVRICCW